MSEDLLRQLAARLKEMMEASSAQWARDQVEKVDGEARAVAERAGRAAEAAAANAAAAETLTAEIAGDPSPAAIIRQADAIATARGRTEQAAQAAESSRRQLATLLEVHRPAEPPGGGTPPSPSPAESDKPDAGPAPTVAVAPEPAGNSAIAAPPAGPQPTLQPAPVLTSADGPAFEQVGVQEAGLQRGVAQTTAAAWLGDRIERMVRRLQGDPSSLSSPDARVAMRALEMRQRNLDAAAADLVAALQAEQAELRKARQEGRPPVPDPQRAARLKAANAAFVDTAGSVAAAMEPVLARLPKEEADWARVMRDSFDWLVEQRRQEAERTAQEAASRPPPEPTLHQKRVLEAAREANPALPPVNGPRTAPLPQGLQAALNAARLNHIARTVRTPSALYNLANALLNADGVARAPQQAAAIMKDLAEDGFRPAQLRMAEIAMLGDGQPADPAQALAWYRIAALRGSTAAQKAGAAYAVELSPEVRAEAERILAQWLAMHGPDTKPGQDELDRNLAKAIERQDYAEVERLLQEGADPQSLDDSGRTALVGASWRGRRSIVRLLMEHGVMTDLRDADNRSALLWSAINGYPQIADDLLDFGANVDITDAFGATPLIRAAWNGKYAVAERLLAAGADARRRDSEGRSAVDRAAANDDDRMLRLLGARPGQL
ncbi:ankyrin repeat domain-containing protein [Marinibaculum pumilum]|uniref:Ankyrin repeat domain-containing protein n=1 Tax=Marinibaculum pumilum TaxID=1766165 RepID=A0ABV7L4L8_9PROT